MIEITCDFEDCLNRDDDGKCTNPESIHISEWKECECGFEEKEEYEEECL